jgi:DNA polymerase III alpha subunit
VLADLDGDVGVLLFSDQLEKNRRLLVEDSVVLVTGQVRDSAGDIEIRAERIEALEEVSGGDLEVVLSLGAGISMAQMLQLRNVLSESRGPARVVLRVALPDGEVRVAAGEEFRVKLDDELLQRLTALLGQGRVSTRLAREADPVATVASGELPEGYEPDEMAEPPELAEPVEMWSEA